jgi:hypothetical protein
MTVEIKERIEKVSDNLYRNKTLDPHQLRIIPDPSNRNGVVMGYCIQGDWYSVGHVDKVIGEWNKNHKLPKILSQAGAFLFAVLLVWVSAKWKERK